MSQVRERTGQILPRLAFPLLVAGMNERAGSRYSKGRRTQLGHVVTTVVREAPCPVLTLHQPERDFVLP